MIDGAAEHDPNRSGEVANETLSLIERDESGDQRRFAQLLAPAYLPRRLTEDTPGFG